MPDKAKNHWLNNAPESQGYTLCGRRSGEWENKTIYIAESSDDITCKICSKKHFILPVEEEKYSPKIRTIIEEVKQLKPMELVGMNDELEEYFTIRETA